MKKREITAGCKFGLRYIQPPHNEAPAPSGETPDSGETSRKPADQTISR